MSSNSSAPIDSTDKHVDKLQEMQIFAKQMLRKRMFHGSYVERRYVEVLDAYRDVVVLSDTQTDFERDLKVVIIKILKYCKNISWLGITFPNMYPGAPPGVCLWTHLNGTLFGQYWFKIRRINFTPQGEVFLEMKRVSNFMEQILNISEKNRLAQLSKEKSNASESSQDISTQSTESATMIPEEFKIDIAAYFVQFKNLLTNDLIPTLKTTITFNNITGSLKFVIAAFIGLIYFFVTFIGMVGEYSLKMVHELTLLVRAFTPIFLCCVDAGNKMVGGFYILLAMLWRDRNVPQPQKQNQARYPALNANSPNSGRMRVYSPERRIQQ